MPTADNLDGLRPLLEAYGLYCRPSASFESDASWRKLRPAFTFLTLGSSDPREKKSRGINYTYHRTTELQNNPPPFQLGGDPFSCAAATSQAAAASCVRARGLNSSLRPFNKIYHLCGTDRPTDRPTGRHAHDTASVSRIASGLHGLVHALILCKRT